MVLATICEVSVSNITVTTLDSGFIETVVVFVYTVVTLLRESAMPLVSTDVRG